MGDSPMAPRTGINKPTAQAEGKDLLLYLLECQLVVVPHPDEFLDLFLISCWHIDLMVEMVGKAPGNRFGITFIRFLLDR